MVFSNGAIVNDKLLVGECKLKENSKLLLFPIPSQAKPEGTRWWCRFPDHDLVEYIYTSTAEQAICFVPTEDIFVLGYGLYIH
jgi:hypothetical protein